MKLAPVESKTTEAGAATFPDFFNEIDGLTLSLQVSRLDAGDLQPFDDWLAAVATDAEARYHFEARRLMALRRRDGWGSAASLERHLRSFAPQLGNRAPFEQWLLVTACDALSFWHEMAVQLQALRFVENLRRGRTPVDQIAGGRP